MFCKPLGHYYYDLMPSLLLFPFVAVFPFVMFVAVDGFRESELLVMTENRLW